jgi:hypothetical protein
MSNFVLNWAERQQKLNKMLQTDYGDEILSCSGIFELFKQFKDRRDDLQDDPKSRRPSSSWYGDAIVNGREIMTRDPRLTLRMMVDELNISKDTIRQILLKIYRRGRSVQRSSKSLVDEQKQLRHHAKTSSRLVKTIPVFFIAL